MSNEENDIIYLHYFPRQMYLLPTNANHHVKECLILSVPTRESVNVKLTSLQFTGREYLSVTFSPNVYGHG